MDRIERLPDLDAVREDWDKLAAGAGHMFATWEWTASWWQYAGGGRELFSFACRDERGQLIAILPMYVWARRPVRVARFLGRGDLASPLCLPEHRGRAAECLRRTLGRGSERCSLLIAENLPAGEDWERLLGGVRLLEKPDPVLEIGGRDWEQLLADQSRRFRKRTRQQERRLQRDFELSYRLAGDGAPIEDDVATLVELHRARWGDKASGLFDGPRGAAVRAALLAAHERGWLRLWLLELDGRPVAADLAWRWNGAEWAINSGRDPEFDRRSVGAVLMAHAVREACEDGIDTYRLLQGDSSYKLDYATAVRHTRTVLVGGRGAIAAARAGMWLLGTLPEGAQRRALRRLA